MLTPGKNMQVLQKKNNLSFNVLYGKSKKKYY